MMPDNQFNPAPIPFEQCLTAYQKIIAQFGLTPVIQPARIPLFGWDLEYISSPALASFIDQILVRRLNDFIPDNERPLILDCGANIGFTVLNYKRQFPQSRIIAFEPDPQFAPVLRRNLQRNGAADVEVVEAAAWVRNGQAQWLRVGADGSRLAPIDEAILDTATVPTVDLADYLKGAVDLLKLDIEGSEYELIDHLGPCLKNVKNIVIECHLNQRTFIPFGKMLDVLKKWDFMVSVNSFGPWRDLLRQPPVQAYYWEQYLLVAGWRGEIRQASTQPSTLPYTGAHVELETWNIRAELERAQHDQAKLMGGQGKDLARKLALFESYMIKGKHRRLKPRFTAEGERSWVTQLEDLELYSDDLEHPDRSTVLLFEDEKILGPAHSLHDDIRRLGGGRFSHWQTELYFSTSDGSNPNSNGRKYSIVFLQPEH